MKVEEIITKQIIDYLKEGKIPWKQPWMNIFPQNFATKREYSGINFFLLTLATKKKNYKYPYFLTYRQALGLDGQVKKGEKSTLITYWDTFKVNEKDKNGDDKIKKIPFVKYYRVFNVEQCDGIKVEEGNKHKKDMKYDSILAGYKDAPKVEENGNRASYNPVVDKVSLPPLSQFKDLKDYYAVLYHELIHSTGFKTRLARFGDDDTHIFGSEVYSKEELIAELGSAFLCARCSIDNRLVQNSAGYIQSWLKVLKGNPKWIISAASKAQKAVNYILDEKKP